MTKTKSLNPAVSNRPRIGEGAQIDAQIVRTQLSDGSVQLGYSFDLTDVPVPDRKYTADIALIQYSNEVLKLGFGQEKMGIGDGLRSLLVVHFVTRGASQFIDSMAQMSAPSFEELLNASPVQARELYELTEEPSQTLAFSANLLSVAISGREACLDFYNASPFSMAKMQSSSKLSVEPVVRVDISLGLLAALHKKLGELKNSFPVH
jgi:hypothetical protein